jgi:hypothetical protein
MACEDDTFYSRVLPKLTTLDDNKETTKEEIVERKFSIAGGSVRWMFGMQEDAAIKDIHDWIKTCNDMKSILNGMTGAHSEQAVNHLLGHYKLDDETERHPIISRFVAVEISKHCEASFVVAASNLSISFFNPSWDGWVFQIDFFMQLRTAHEKMTELRLTNKATKKSVVSSSSKKDQPDEKIIEEGTVEAWKVPNQIEFHNVKDLQGAKVLNDPRREYENKKTIQENDWLICTKWNQGCYDAAQLLPSNKLRIVQITRAKSHSLKLRFIRTLIAALISIGFQIDKDGIDVVFVVPSEDVFEFNLSPNKVIGDLTEWNWKCGMERVLGLNRTKL